MIDIKVDQEIFESILLEKVNDRIKTEDFSLVFWDRKELERRTCMCWTTIQKEFLFDPDFPKHKIGSKWYFPAKEAQEFLLSWIATKGY